MRLLDSFESSVFTIPVSQKRNFVVIEKRQELVYSHAVAHVAARLTASVRDQRLLIEKQVLVSQYV